MNKKIHIHFLKTLVAIATPLTLCGFQVTYSVSYTLFLDVHCGSVLFWVSHKVFVLSSWAVESCDL